MGSGKRTWGFRANSEENRALKKRVDEHGESRTEAVKYYLRLGIQAEKESERGARAAEDSSVLKVLIAQMAVAALAILMMGPGMNVVPETASWYVSLGLLVAAAWLLAAVRFRWFSRARNRIERHVSWAKAEVGRDDTPDAEADV